MLCRFFIFLVISAFSFTSFLYATSTGVYDTDNRKVARKFVQKLEPQISDDIVLKFEDSHEALRHKLEACHPFWVLMAALWESGNSDLRNWHDDLMKEGFGMDNTLIQKVGYSWDRSGKEMSETEKRIVQARFCMEEKTKERVSFTSSEIWTKWKESNKGSKIISYIHNILDDQKIPYDELVTKYQEQREEWKEEKNRCIKEVEALLQDISNNSNMSGVTHHEDPLSENTLRKTHEAVDMVGQSLQELISQTEIKVQTLQKSLAKVNPYLVAQYQSKFSSLQARLTIAQSCSPGRIRDARIQLERELKEKEESKEKYKKAFESEDLNKGSKQERVDAHERALTQLAQAKSDPHLSETERAPIADQHKKLLQAKEQLKKEISEETRQKDQNDFDQSVQNIASKRLIEGQNKILQIKEKLKELVALNPKQDTNQQSRTQAGQDLIKQALGEVNRILVHNITSPQEACELAQQTMENLKNTITFAKEHNWIIPSLHQSTWVDAHQKIYDWLTKERQQTFLSFGKFTLSGGLHATWTFNRTGANAALKACQNISRETGMNLGSLDKKIEDLIKEINQTQTPPNDDDWQPA